MLSEPDGETPSLSLRPLAALGSLSRRTLQGMLPSSTAKVSSGSRKLRSVGSGVIAVRLGSCGSSGVSNDGVLGSTPAGVIGVSVFALLSLNSGIAGRSSFTSGSTSFGLETCAIGGGIQSSGSIGCSTDGFAQEFNTTITPNRSKKAATTQPPAT